MSTLMSSQNVAIVPLVHELPCRHITASFGPCLSNVTVYKWKTITNIGTKLGFKTEAHKLVLITPFYSVNNDDNDNKSFESFILELNFGSKTILSSGAYMQCLNCAKFINDNMIQCSPSFTCCIEKDFIINIMETFINTIKFFGPRKCNCQSYVYYILRCFGVADNLLLDANIVETDFGYIHLTVKQLAINMEYHRPTCQGDINDFSIIKTLPYIVVEPIPIPSLLEQLEINEYKDEAGKNYLIFLFGFISANLVIITIGICLFYWLIGNKSLPM